MSDTEIEITFPLPVTRPRRLRSHLQLRRLVQENHLQIDDLILPLFIHHGSGDKTPIQSMPGHYQLHIENIKEEIKEINALKIPAVILFGIPEEKNAIGSSSFDSKGVIQRAIHRAIQD